MTAIAYVNNVDRLRRWLDFYVGDETPNGITQVFGDGTQKFLPRGEAETEPSKASFSLGESHARALLSALLRHFEGGDDLRALRKDYDAERARVDKLIDLATRAPVVVHS